MSFLLLQKGTEDIRDDIHSRLDILSGQWPEWSYTHPPTPKSATRGKFGINNKSPTREASYGSRHWSIAQKVYLCFTAETFITVIPW